MSIRLIHTADVHLDECFAGAGLPPNYASRRRQQLREVFRAIVERAGEWPADALLIAGDLFELDRVSRDTVAFLRDRFAAIEHVPVFIAPGNHDPWVAHSPYATEAWPDNVHIFSTPEWSRHALSHTPLTVHGFGFDGVEPSRNPFGELAAPDDGRTHVAVAHGSARSHQPEGKAAYAPFDGAEAAADGLAYLALGHFHSATAVEGPYPARIQYSGAPEGHGFGDSGMRHYLEVEIANGEVAVRPVPSSRSVYESHRLDISAFTNTQEVIDAVRALPSEEGVARIARITLTGSAGPALQEGMAGLYDVLSEQFEYLRLIDETHPQDDYEELANPTTSLGLFLERINQEIADSPSEEHERMLRRARQAGLFAYRGQQLPVRGTREA